MRRRWWRRRHDCFACLGHPQDDLHYYPNDGLCHTHTREMVRLYHEKVVQIVQIKDHAQPLIELLADTEESLHAQ